MVLVTSRLLLHQGALLAVSDLDMTTGVGADSAGIIIEGNNGTGLGMETTQ